MFYLISHFEALLDGIWMAYPTAAFHETKYKKDFKRKCHCVCLRAKGKNEIHLKVSDKPEKQKVWSGGVCVCVCLFWQTSRLMTELSPALSGARWVKMNPAHTHHHTASHVIPSVFQPVLHLSGASLCLVDDSPSSNIHSILLRATYTTYTHSKSKALGYDGYRPFSSLWETLSVHECVGFFVGIGACVVYTTRKNINSLFSSWPSSLDTWATMKSTSFGQNIPETTVEGSSQLNLETC